MIRVGPWLMGQLPLFSDQAGHRGVALASATGTTRLFVDGEKLGEIARPGTLGFVVPDAPARYRLETEAIRDRAELSTRLTAAWTFDSASSDDVFPLPLSAIRFAPFVDAHNRAPAGLSLLPLAFERGPGAPAAPLASLTLAVSYDDGVTWKRALLVRWGDRALALLAPPAQAAFVSLDASAAQPDGTRVEHTIIRAYGLGTVLPN